MTPLTPKNPAVSSIRLAAVLTAVSLSREFIRHTLTTWQLSDHIESAELVVSEPATNAIKETGVTDPSPKGKDIRARHVIGVQLRAVGTGLYVEVWDRADGTPVIPEQSLDAEGGRGLCLVEALSERWDIYRPAVGGKIIWAELSLTEPVNPLLLDKKLPQSEPGSHGSLAGSELELVNLALRQRALDGLRHPSGLIVAG